MKIEFWGSVSRVAANVLKKLATFSKMPMGALELSDAHIRFFGIRGNEVVSFGLRIAPGIIVDGKITDRANFKIALRKIFEGVRRHRGERIGVVMALPHQATYLQSFFLPYLKKESLEDAAKLNMQVSSPLPFEDVYYDWEIVGETNEGDEQLVILGAYAEKSNIETVISLCHEVGFVLVAVEPAIISLARAVNESSGIDLRGEAILLSADEVGIDFARINNGKISFNYFVTWQSIYGNVREVSKQVFKDGVIRHMRRVVTFSGTAGAAQKTKVLITTTALAEELEKIINENFNCETIRIVLDSIAKLGPAWGVSLGAYYRTLVPRRKDNMLSLEGVSAIEEYHHALVINFSALWRNVLALVFSFVFLVFLGGFIYVRQVSFTTEAGLPRGLADAEVLELTDLQAQAVKFNELLGSLSGGVAAGQRLHGYMAKLFQITPPSIAIERVFFQSFSQPVLIIGTGNNETTVIEYKNALLGEPLFSGVDLPLTSIQPTSDDRYKFSITLFFASGKTP